MSLWRVVGFLVGFVFVTVNSRLGIESSLQLAHCRATCLHKMNLTQMSDPECRASYHCSQCWNVCGVLQTSKSVCKETSCIAGCRESCHWFSLGMNPSTLLSQPLEQLSFHRDSVSWPHINTTFPNTVYVVMVRHGQHAQTLDLKSKLPLNTDPLTVQVLVVDWRGFTEVFTPRPPSPVELARAVISQMGLDHLMGLHEHNTSLSLGSDEHDFRLKEVSKTYHRDFVTVHISWKGQSTTLPTYLVTWQVEDGSLTGNLLTNTSRATLSIATDTIYRIQVALFTLENSHRMSDFLRVNTFRPPRGLFYLHSYIIHPPEGFCWCMLVPACAVVLVLLTLTWRFQKRTQPVSKHAINYRDCTPKKKMSLYENEVSLSSEHLLKTMSSVESL